MKSYGLILLTAILTGCLASNGLQYEAVSETNLYHIAKVRKGMSEKEVLHIMHKPYSYESFEVSDDIYDVWFYVTRATGLDQTRMVPQNLTPLTFKNGILVGTGYYWYYYAMKEQANEVAAQNPVEKPKTQDQEDTEFENALKTYPKKETAPSKMPAQTTMLTPKPSGCGLKNISLVRKGMTETEVHQVMGEPNSNKTFEFAGDFYDVWFYEAIPSKTGQKSMVPQQSKPLIFKNDYLVSMSDDYYFELKDKVDRNNQISKPAVVEEAPMQDELASQNPSLKSPATLLKPWNPVLGAKKVEMSKVRTGMGQAEVIDLLGSPNSQETYQMNNDVYEVWFYDITPSNGNKVPLTFKNGTLVGMTDDYYNNIKKKAKRSRIGGYNPPAEQMQQEESEQNFDYW